MTARSEAMIELYGFEGAKRLAMKRPALLAEIERTESEALGIGPSPEIEIRKPIQYPSNHVSRGVI